jgi:hypothetical protein
VIRGLPSILAVAAISLGACKRDAASDAAASANAPAASAASATSAAPKAAGPWYAGAWIGDYDAAASEADKAPGALREWAKDDGKQATGKGSVKVTVDEQGVAQGEADGALGAHAVSGSADADSLRLALSPKGDADPIKGFRAIAVVKREGEVLRGTLHAGSGDGVTLRRALLELRRAAP